MLKSFTKTEGTRHLAVLLAFVFLAFQMGQAQTLTIIHNFTQNGPDGYRPYAGVTIDPAGNLYGTSIGGGGTGYSGVLFKMTQVQGSWLFNPLYAFAGAHGTNPMGQVTRASNGALYGTTFMGGSSGVWGTVYEVRPGTTAPVSAIAFWNENVLHNFTGAPDGAFPYSQLVFDSQGNLYGTAYLGGANSDGMVFELTPSSGGWTESTLYSFTGLADGGSPWSGVVFDTAGNLYGTTMYDGNNNCGAVYKLSPNGSGWTETTLYTFPGDGSEGCGVQAGVILDAAGNLYGATITGGAYGSGTVFELSPSNGSYTFNVIYAFPSGPHNQPYCAGNGFGPAASLVMDSAGNLYGTTIDDGEYGWGSVFELSPGEAGWAYTSLHDFTPGVDGENPCSSVAFDAQGNLYGTTSLGGATGWGTVWQITR